MADKMFLTIVLRKEVPDRDTGSVIYNLVKERMTDRPDIKVTGSVSNHFDNEPEAG